MTPVAFTVALGAALLFVSEPAAGKTILPWLGGTPAAWGTTLLFFQLALILGYGVVDRALRCGGARAVAMAHTSLVLLAALVLAWNVPFTGLSAPEAATVGRTLALLALEIGVPIAALALTAPALQAWSVVARGERGAAGYSLYAASNAGSLIGLLAYPFLVEPRFPLSLQWNLWRGGFWVFAMFVAGLWVVGWRRSKGEKRTVSGVSGRSDLPSKGEWFIRSAIPAALLAAITAYITRDLAPIPLLWVIPLALYLATWIAAFSGRLRGLIDRATAVQDLFATVGVLVLIQPAGALFGALLSLAALVVVCLTQHGALARSAPPESHLGRFYVWLAAGGAAGTAVVVVLGPAIFPLPVEAPLAFALAVVVGRPAGMAWTRAGTLRFLGLAGLGAALPWFLPMVREPWIASLCIVAAALVLTWRSDPRRAGTLLATLAGLALVVEVFSPRYLGSAHGILGRFVVHRNREGTELISGSTWHGYEPRGDSAGRPVASLYYTRLGPYGDLVRLLEARGPGWRFGVVGLGIGSLACTAEPGTRFTFFEINRGVVRLARDTSLFRSLSVCAPDADVRLGDARLTLANAPERFDLLTLDAFNSDAIPTHLLTREALALYSTRVAEGGVIAFHVSNRYLDLPRVVNALAADAGWAAAQTRIAPPAGAFPPGDSWATWITMVALARDSATLALLVATTRWRWAGRAGPVWTDDWTPLAGVLRLSRENLLGR